MKPKKNRNQPVSPQKEALRIAGIYLVLALLWILASDRFLLWITNDPVLLSNLETAKGWCFVAVTTGLLFFLVRRTLLSATRAERAMRQKERLLNNVVEVMPVGVWIADKKGTILMSNPASREIWGGERLVGTEDYGVFRGWWTDTGSPLKSEEWGMVKAIRNGEASYDEKIDIECFDGSRKTILHSAVPLRDEDGNLLGGLVLNQDITDRKRYEEQLEYQANHDALTGLANRNLLADRLAQGIALAQRGKKILAVLLMDLDRFKVVNESLGHGQGDLILCSVAERLADNVRAADTIARLGGDEFVIVLGQMPGIDEIGLVARKILETLSRPHRVNGREITLSASIGISLFPRDGEDGETLIRNADVAMYKAKKDGGNNFHFYSPEMNERVMETLELESDLRRALEREELFLHFQPKVDLQSGRIAGAEALVRWNHPRKGLMSPGIFIPLAEETGLIVPLGEWVLRAACAQAAQWQMEGLPEFTMAVNLSARQFRQKGLAATLCRILVESGLEPRWLELELTESMVMHDPVTAAATMNELKALGIGLCLDDFGTGYSSLEYLRRFPIATLKIDRSFIADVTTDPSGAAVTTSIVAIAHSLGLNAVAEGVETSEQLEFLRSCRCDSYQGFYFSKPVSPESFARLLK